MITPRPPMIELPAVPLDQALDYLSQACEQVAATPPQLQQHLILQGSMFAVETTIAALYARVAELEAAQEPTDRAETNGQAVPIDVG